MRIPRILPRRRGRTRGQSLVEFALVLPIMLLLLAGAIDLGRLFYAYVAVENAAKEGALFGARSPLCDDSLNVNCDNPNNVVWHVRNEATNIGSQFNTTVACRTPAGALVAPINDCLDGYTYQVTVSYPFRLITPILGSLVNQTITLRSESQATVISDAFDPSGLELLVWANSTNATNGTTVAAACTQADATSSPNFYYAPCQDSLNVDNYLQYQENTVVSYKVRVRNTGNLALTGISYGWTANGSTITAPGNCGTLPSSIGKGAAASFCTFTRTVTAASPVNGIADYVIAGTAQGNAGGLSTGQTNGAAIVKVQVPPKLAVNLRASQYRLGQDGNGVAGAPSYGAGGMTLQRNTSSTLPEIKDPTGWFYLTVVNQGTQANNFSVSVTQNGTAITLPCTLPTTLAESGQSGSVFTCIFPRTFDQTQAYAFVTTATADNAVLVGGQQPNVTVTTATACTASKPVMPNVVNVLDPTADGTSKTVGQAKALWAAAGFSGTVSTTPAGAPNSATVVTQNQLAYTCANNASQAVTVGAP
jgi:Flp pilus assembly protein TadG